MSMIDDLRAAVGEIAADHDFEVVYAGSKYEVTIFRFCGANVNFTLSTKVVKDRGGELGEVVRERVGAYFHS
jgi:hypothetical protein